MSDTPCSPERLRELANFAGRKETADALRDFASLVSVLERDVAPELEQTASHSGRYVARGFRGDDERQVVADTPLAALLALADALDAGRGDAG